MPKFTVETYELHRVMQTVEAEDEVAACIAVFQGQGEADSGSKFVEMAKSYGVPVESFPLEAGTLSEIRRRFSEANMLSDGDIVGSICSVEPDEDQEGEDADAED